MLFALQQQFLVVSHHFERPGALCLYIPSVMTVDLVDFASSKLSLDEAFDRTSQSSDQIIFRL